MKRNDFLKNSIPGALVFMSGSGTNAENLLRSPACGTSWFCSAVVTDKPGTSRAREIAERFHLPLVEDDIGKFYREHGLDRVTLAGKGLELRNLWTDGLRKKIAPFRHDFGLLAGFIPLTNIVADFPCLNVHPGDLTITGPDGQRLYAGLHSLPVENAILDGRTSLRSSVIRAVPYTPGVREVDEGSILGISAPMPVLLPQGVTLGQLREIAKNRKKGFRNDLLGTIADDHIERLKQEGDWKVFPAVVDNFARGNYSRTPAGGLLWRENGEWIPVRTVEFIDGIPHPIKIGEPAP